MMRLDIYVSESREGISRSRAKSLITSGNVRLDGECITKPSFIVDDSIPHELDVREDALPYVSRGGLKLEGALKCFGVKPIGRVCADIGASTGGFTDCLLSLGATRVFAVDSGSDQLAESLRRDARVVSLEHFNARDLTEDTFGEPTSLVVSDVSFISLTYILPAVRRIISDGGEFIGLIKPQFECGREALGKGGIVKDKRAHAAAIRRVIDCAVECGFTVKALASSSIKGGDGNVEFLFHAVASDAPTCLVTPDDVTKAVKAASEK